MTDKTRAGFEAWASEVHLYQPGADMNWNPERNCYNEFGLHFAFQAWQAALATKAAPEPVAQVAFNENGRQYDARPYPAGPAGPQWRDVYTTPPPAPLRELSEAATLRNALALVMSYPEVRSYLGSKVSDVADAALAAHPQEA